MITSLKDNAGRIIAYCEWRLVGPSGAEVPSGEYVWVNDCWVHKDFRMTNRINRIIDEIIRKVPHVKYCYFKRGKRNERIHIYSISQWERRRMSYDNLIQGDN